MDCICTAFYFILRPGEYANSTDDTKDPFRMADVEIKIGGLHIFDARLTTLFQI